MSAPITALARKVFEEYSRSGGNPPDAHFDRNAAEQWMAHALEFAGVAELIEAAGKLRADVFLWRLTGNMPNLQMLANDEEALDAALARVKGA